VGAGCLRGGWHWRSTLASSAVSQAIIPPPPLSRFAYELVQPVWPFIDIDFGGSNGRNPGVFGLQAASSTHTPSKVLSKLLAGNSSSPPSRGSCALSIDTAKTGGGLIGSLSPCRAHTRQFLTQDLRSKFADSWPTVSLANDLTGYSTTCC